MSTKSIIDVKGRLSKDELEAYNKYMDSGKPPLSPSVEAQLYQLYLHGKSCTEIARLNPNFTLGMIVRAKVEHFWDHKRDAHIGDMLDSVKENVRQTQLESINFACDLLTATHKYQGDKLKRYIQTGNPEELASLGNNLSFKTYKEAVQLLLQLTGQDGKSGEKKVTGEIVHKVEAPGAEGVTIEAEKVGLTPRQAAKILEALDDEED